VDGAVYMRYPLINRFQGTFLGALLGELLVQNAAQQDNINSEVSQILVLVTKSLIESSKLDIDNWLGTQPIKSFDLNINAGLFSKTMIATLPVALFFHENPSKLRQNLLAMVSISDNDPLLRDITLALGYAIAQCLSEKLHPHSIIDEIVAFIGETPTPLTQKLLKVKNLLAEGGGLEKAQTELGREQQSIHAVCMGFYCFLSNLEDLPLAVLRATHQYKFWGGKTQNLDAGITSIITGALSGSYNTNLSIPAKWQVMLCPNNFIPGEQSNFSQMLELADALVAVWSGVYDPALHFKDYLEEECVRYQQQPQICVFASPRVIQSR
jgi:ADP-ribosylglycohydrolase